MKILWSWLQDHVSVSRSIDDVMYALTHSGTEAEKTDAYAWTQKFRVAQVLSTTPHPNAEHLTLCDVSLGHDQRVSIVCGAKNVRPHLKTIVALPGCLLPGTSSPLSVSLLRGIASHGMLCSAQELCMEDIFGDMDGLVELSENTEVGLPLRSFLSDDDAVLHLNITPNRGDLFSHRGVARELVSLELGSWKTMPSLDQALFSNLNPMETNISLETPLCPFFQMCHIEGIHQHTTQPWIRRRLMEVSIKSHGPCVDITNYAAEDNGQPLHAFDADAIEGVIHIRTSEEGESFQALDGQTYILPHGLIVVADDMGILSLGGIMGGMRGRCQHHTKNIFLEAACFDPTMIARGGKITRLNSASKSRFERGVDPNFCTTALNAATLEMMRQTGGTIKGLSRMGSIAQRQPIMWDMKSVEEKCGVQLCKKTLMHRLENWGAKVESFINDIGITKEKDDQKVQVTPPSWRWDWQDSWDCVNEVLRGQGYTEVPVTPLPGNAILFNMQKNTGKSLPSLDYTLLWNLRDFWISQGFYEVVTWSFMSAAMAHPFFSGFSHGAKELALENPLSKELNVLRPSVLPSLMAIQQYHWKHGLDFHPIFEIGPRFFGLSPSDQKETLTAFWPIKKSQSWNPSNPHAPKEWSFYDVKFILDSCIAALGIENTLWEPTGPSWYHPGQCARLMQKDSHGKQVELAVIGKIHPRLNMPGFGAELHLNAWTTLNKNPLYAIPSLQPVHKDLSFYLPNEHPIGSVITKIYAMGITPLIKIMIIDMFKDIHEKHPLIDLDTPLCHPHHVSTDSITIRCIFQSHTDPFSSDDLQSLMHQVVQCAQEQGWILRGTLDDPKK